MDNSQDQPLPPGVNFLPNYSSAVPSVPFPPQHGQIPQNSETDNALQSSLTQQGADLIAQQPQDQDTAVEKIPQHKDGTIPQQKGHSNGNSNDSTAYSRLHAENDRDIETAAQDAVLREQEIATQNIIQHHREARGFSGPSEDGKDIFSERRDPNALKEHLLKMTSQHRAEMALKRGKSTVHEEGNLEIGNGYGVPGGGAYYGAPKPNTDNPSKSSELPEYLKQKLRARGILKEDTEKGSPKSETGSTQLVDNGKLPSGWVEAKDPASGASYYYNNSTGKSQWEKPVETPPIRQHTSPLSIPEGWVEALDETTGHKYYYNTKTHISQWERPDSSLQVSLQHPDSTVPRSAPDAKQDDQSSQQNRCFGCGGCGAGLVRTSGYCSHCIGNAANSNWNDQSSELMKCMGCGGWGVGLVQMWGYCNHCTRVLNLPQCQHLSCSNSASTKEDSDKKASKQRLHTYLAHLIL
ncbi:hypothetical protein I3760_10G043800 [Carya illinoinensis]|nr:hypothetical protein I3760_10G043800 [Carya illinoinensis]